MEKIKINVIGVEEIENTPLKIDKNHYNILGQSIRHPYYPF
jgi:hypothetical protein